MNKHSNPKRAARVKKQDEPLCPKPLFESRCQWIRLYPDGCPHLAVFGSFTKKRPALRICLTDGTEDYVSFRNMSDLRTWYIHFCRNLLRQSMESHLITKQDYYAFLEHYDF